MRSRAARFVAGLLLFVSALIATALAIFSLAGYERGQSYMDSLSFDGDAFPERILLLANESAHLPTASVWATNGLDPERMTPRLVRRFPYSSLYEVQPQRGEH